MEIEKKYRVNSLPDHLECYKKKEIMQGYLCKNPVVRIRKSNDNYILTYKNRAGISQEHALSCEEIEMPLSEDAFTHLLEKIDHHVIHKTRYLIPLDGGLTAELDIFHGRLEGLYFTEVEFESEEAAIAFKKPEWFGEDVSFDKRFRNSHLSKVDAYLELGLD